MRMEVPHAHMSESMESMESISAFFLSTSASVSASACSSLCFVHQFSPYPDVSFLGLPPLMYAIFSRIVVTLRLQRLKF
jgi:hypothetical protein